MTAPTTWEECAAAGMSAAQAATHLGKTRQSAADYAKRNGLTFAPDPKGRGGPRENNRWTGFFAQMTVKERRDYDDLKLAHYGMDQALTAIGRADLIGGVK